MCNDGAHIAQAATVQLRVRLAVRHINQPVAGATRTPPEEIERESTMLLAPLNLEDHPEGVENRREGQIPDAEKRAGLVVYEFLAAVLVAFLQQRVSFGNNTQRSNKKSNLIALG